MEISINIIYGAIYLLYTVPVLNKPMNERKNYASQLAKYTALKQHWPKAVLGAANW